MYHITSFSDEQKNSLDKRRNGNKIITCEFATEKLEYFRLRYISLVELQRIQLKKKIQFSIRKPSPNTQIGSSIAKVPNYSRIDMKDQKIQGKILSVYSRQRPTRLSNLSRINKFLNDTQPLPFGLYCCMICVIENFSNVLHSKNWLVVKEKTSQYKNGKFFVNCI